MTSSPTCAVIVPSFNRPDRLRGCLESLVRLDDPSNEIIVVDDGSPVPLNGLCAEFAPRVRCLRQKHRGPAAARNAGVRATSAEFVAFTDDDCRPRPGWLAALLRAQDGRADRLIGGRVENALPANVYSAASQSLCDYLYDYFGASEGSMPFFTSNNTGCARETFEKLGGFDETFPLAAAEDRDFGLRWRAERGPLVYAPDAVVEHGHVLDLRSFWRQHSNYGRGARHLHLVMSRRGDARPKVEPLGFYTGLVLHPVRKPGRMRLPQAVLLALSQLAMICGYAAESRRDRQAGCPQPSLSQAAAGE